MKYKITYVTPDEEVFTKVVIVENLGTTIDDIVSSNCIIEECHPA